MRGYGGGSLGFFLAVTLTPTLARACPSHLRSAPSPVVGAHGGVIAVVDVAVIPMDRERVLPHQTVLMQGDRIIALGPAATTRVPRGAVRVDGRGKFLLPGLADMHAHVPNTLVRMHQDQLGNGALAEGERMLTLFAVNGVTTIRIMGYARQAALELRRRTATGALLGPRIYAAAFPGELFSPPTLDSGAQGVARAKAAGYDFVKLYSHGPEHDAYADSVAAAAHRLGIPLVGHAPNGRSGLAAALRRGYSSIEHLTGFSEYLTADTVAWFSRGSWQQPVVLDTAKLRAVAAELRRAGVWNCPTLALFELNRFGRTMAQWPELRYVSDSTLQWWRQPATIPVPGGDTAARVQSMLAARAEVVRALRDAGAGLLLGTDEPVPFLVPGFSVHRELEALVRAGLTPYEALAAGTRNVAEYLGTLDSTGTVAVGKRADLVLLDGNPLEDIRHTMRVRGVMLGGRWLGRAELDRRLTALEGKAF